jgi:DNA repair exonuclease
VDAVVHTGDIFDHQNTPRDRDHVRQEIRQTVTAGTPFYYVHGNHDTESGRQLLDETPGVHIPEDRPTVGDRSVNLIGVDYSDREVPDRDLVTSPSRRRHPNVVVMHETPYPVVADDGSRIYDAASESVHLARTAENTQYEIDAVVTGHHHTAEQARVKRQDIPVLVTGSTIPISELTEGNQPSTWLLTITSDGVELTRQPL